jgi:hypothetical protein
MQLKTCGVGGVWHVQYPTFVGNAFREWHPTSRNFCGPSTLPRTWDISYMKSISMLRTRCGGRQKMQTSTRGSTCFESSPRDAELSSLSHSRFCSCM